MAYKSRKSTVARRGKKMKKVKSTEDASKGKKNMYAEMTGLMSKSSAKHPML